MAKKVFISYCREDQSYVDWLARFLVEAGIEVWYDHHLERGGAFPRVIAQQIRECAALVVVMSPAAEESEWVDREVKYARDRGKPVLPLLLDGRPLFLVATNDYEDVRGEKTPSDGWVKTL